jgi:predicted permease
MLKGTAFVTRSAMPGVWNDVRYAARSLRHAPAFTTAALVTLALGIGGTTAVFSLVNAVMLRTLPVSAPDSLVFVGHRNPSDTEAGVSLISNPAWLERLRRSGIFDGVAAYNLRDFKVASGEGVEQVVGQFATGNYHALVGVPMALGRGFTSERDFTPGASPIAVISDGYWQRRYQRSPDALGARLVVGGHAVTIVGVTAAGFHGLQPGRSIEITLPLSIRVQDEPDFETSLDSWTNMPLVARLRSGATAVATEGAVDAVFREHMATPGIGFGRSRDGRFLLKAAVVPAARGADRLRREYETALRVLMIIVAAVLAIACVNVASLFLARGAARTREIAMRLALGASRWRVVRQLLAEGSIVAIGGGVIGFVAAALVTSYVATLLRGGQRPIAIDLLPDGRVLVFTLAVAATSALLFGLLPALRATDLTPTVRESIGGASTARRSRGRMMLVAGQLAMCIVLVFGAALLVRTLRNLQQLDDRFSTDTVVAFGLDANDTAFPPNRLAALCLDAIERLRRTDAATGSCSTMTPLDTAREIRELGWPELPPGRGTTDILSNIVSPDYFAVFGIEAVRGRLFAASDSAAAPRVAILNEAAARHFFAGRDPIGQQIGFGSRPDPTQAATVIGVVRDVRHWPRETPVPMVYEPLDQQPDPPDYLAGAIRTAGDPAAARAQVPGVVRSLTPELAVPWVRSLRQQMQAALVTERLLATLSALFGALGLLLAAIGVYGVIAYEVARRTREIGIRMALGAQRRAVLGSVLRQVALIVVPGVAAGVTASLMASSAVERLLFGIGPHDPPTIAATSLILTLVSFAAAYIPARRAASVDPSMTLRGE